MIRLSSSCRSRCAIRITFPCAIRALEAGKYVNIDKPIAVNYEEALKLEACARRHPGKLFARQNRRFEGPFQKARQLISTGVLGNITLIKLHRACGYCRRNDWMTMTEFAGGLLTNWGPHVIDQALQLIGSPVVDMWADVRSVISIGDGDDQIKLLLRGKNGIVADLEISGTNAKPDVKWKSGESAGHSFTIRKSEQSKCDLSIRNVNSSH